MLGLREVLDDTKIWFFFELDELTLGFTPEQKYRYLMWVRNSKKITGQIKNTAAKDALKQLQEKGLVFTTETIKERYISLELTEIGKREGEKRTWGMCIVLEVCRHTGSRAENITGTLASIKIPRYLSCNVYVEWSPTWSGGSGRGGDINVYLKERNLVAFSEFGPDGKRQRPASIYTSKPELLI